MDTLTRMRAFIDVVEAEGFSAAARKIGRSKALLSKYVRELEDELGALLLNRTTRQFSLTEAGHTYYRRASEIVREVDSLADAVRESSGDVRGRIKLSAPRTFADAPIGQSLVDFAKEHPDIVLEIDLDDRFVDLVEEGFDLAIRISRLESSSLIAKRLSPFSVRICGSPELIAKHGTPTKPQDFARLPCIVDTNGRWLSNWPFKGDTSDTISVSVSGPLEVNSPMVARAAAVSGLGFAILPDFIAAPEIIEGRLVPVLDDRILQGGGIFAVYPHRRYLPAKVRVFVDFLAQWFKAREAA
jgi:DNA-binding transcriptional LysR family regulator